MQSYKPRLFYLNPTFHNPTGYTIPAEQRKRLVELAQQYQCLLIEDDPYRDIYFGKKPPLPLFAYDTEGWTIYIRSFQQIRGPGAQHRRYGLPPARDETYLKSQIFVQQWNAAPESEDFSALFLFAADAAASGKAADRAGDPAGHHGGAACRGRLGVVQPGGGFNLWVKLPETVSIDRLLVESVKQSITFVPGSICDPLRSFSSWIRLSYSYLNEQQSREGLEAVCRVVPDAGALGVALQWAAPLSAPKAAAF